MVPGPSLGPRGELAGDGESAGRFPDGRYLFFCRDQRSYWIEASVVDDLRRLETSRFGQRSAAEELEPLLVAGNPDQARQRFKAIRERETNRFFVDEAEFNALGYRLLQRQKTGEAQAVFEMNTVAFPGSWNAWDSLGESLMIGDQSERAEQCYEKSLALNPASPSGRENLARLRSTRLGNELDGNNETRAAKP